MKCVSVMVILAKLQPEPTLPELKKKRFSCVEYKTSDFKYCCKDHF